MRYFGLGGSADLMELDAHVAGVAPLPPAQADMLAHAVNERLDELVAEHRLPYSRPILRNRRALGTARRAGGTARRRRIRAPRAAAAHRRRRGPRPGRRGHPLPDRPRAPGARPVPLRRPRRGGRLARRGQHHGRAGLPHRRILLASDREDRPRLWVPVLDGADRLGVLEVPVARHGRCTTRPCASQCLAGPPAGSPPRLDGALRGRAGALPAQPAAGALGRAHLAAAPAADRCHGLLRARRDARAELPGGRRRLRLRAVGGHGVARHLRRRRARDAGRAHGRRGPGRLPQRPPGRAGASSTRRRPSTR